MDRSLLTIAVIIFFVYLAATNRLRKIIEVIAGKPIGTTNIPQFGGPPKANV